MRHKPAILVRPVTPRDGRAIEQLFGPRGAVGGCWCMYWRREKGGKSWDAVKGEPNRVDFLSLLAKGKVTGAIAFANDAPIGWCCIGPRSSFPRFLRSRVYMRPTAPDTWSVTCFFIVPQWRGKGIATRLLAGAIDLAWSHGAKTIEAFPALRSDCDALVPAFAWTGTIPMFAKAGFEPTPENNRIWLKRRGERPRS